MKRILILVNRDIANPHSGGAQIYTHEIAKRLVKDGYKVTIFCSKYKNAKKEEIIDGIRIIRRGTEYTVYFHAFINYLLKLRNECDILIEENNAIPFFSPLYVRKPKFILIHQLIKEVFSIALRPPLDMIGKTLESLMPIFYKKVDFLTVSESTKKDLVKIGIPKHNIEIVYNGVDHRKYKPNKKSRIPTVVYIGRLEKYKRADLLIKVIPHIVSELKNVKFWIAGYGNAAYEIEKLVRKLNLPNHVNFFGRISENKKIQLLQKAWLIVSPSIREGWCLSLLEANSCGTPGIAFNVPGLKNSIKNNKTGVLISDNNIKEFTNRIIFLLKNRRLLDSLSKNALEWSYNFSWEKTYRKFNLFLKKFKF
jgi:glycosyltransferase involved in cell wall biosynthesis